LANTKKEFIKSFKKHIHDDHKTNKREKKNILKMFQSMNKSIICLTKLVTLMLPSKTDFPPGFLDDKSNGNTDDSNYLATCNSTGNDKKENITQRAI